MQQVITRTVLVDYDLSPAELLALAVQSGRTPYVDPAVLAAMPRPVGMSGRRQVQAKIFKPRSASYLHDFIRKEGLLDEYRFYGLVPDPWLAFALNTADPSFADQHPNGVPWRYCYAAFRRWWYSGPNVNVNHNNGQWNDLWLFVGRSE